MMYRPAASAVANSGTNTLPPSSSVIAILKVPSTITTTLAPTSSERIFEVMVEASLSPAAVALLALIWAAAAFLLALIWALLGGCAAWAAWAARRAAAMKLDAVAGSGVPVEISLMAFSEAAIRSDGEPGRPAGRVPGSSG